MTAEEVNATDSGYSPEPVLDPASPSSMARTLEATPPADRQALLADIAPAALVETLAMANRNVARGHLDLLTPDAIASAAASGADAASAQILRDIHPEIRDEALDAMDAQARARLEALLSFPADTAGGVMQLDTLAVRGDVSIQTVRRYLRRRGAIPLHTNRLMVVDRDNRFSGTVRLGELFLHDDSTLVATLVEQGVEPLRPDTPLQEVVNVFEQRELISLPVVDASGTLLGRVTIDEVVPLIRRDSEHQVMRRAGLSEDDDMLAGGWTTAKRRMVWLGVNLLTALLAAWVIGLFDATIEKVVALAVLMPVIASMGGIAGTQTLTVVVRGLALGRLDRSQIPWMLRRELVSAAINGLVWALLVGALAFAWFGSLSLGAVVATALLANQFAAALAGATIPLILEKLRIDPALAGGVILTTVTDVVGFFTLLGLGTALLLT